MSAASAVSRDVVQSLVASKIRLVANAAMGDPDVLPFWFGEPDEVTPEFIRRAGMDSLAAGDTFYTHNYGIPSLREALAGYLTRLHRPTTPAQLAITNSGMNALMLVTQALIGPGDRVVAVVPLWPNICEIPKVVGASVERVALDFGAEGWTLDTDRLFRALVPGTRAVYINSPNNPTGWTISAEQQRAILDHCRKHGIWIIADDAYERLYFNPPFVAPSFLDIADANDRVVSTNTFSKSWLMTGWRLGWIVAPEGVMTDMGKLIEYNTSCAPVFVQKAGEVAVREGEPVIARTLERFRHARDLLVGELRRLPGVAIATPPGAMYAFFQVQGVTDSLGFCKRLVAEAKLGVAPGSAFGPEGEGFVRWCFAASDERLLEGIARLTAFMKKG